MPLARAMPTLPPVVYDKNGSPHPDGATAPVAVGRTAYDAFASAWAAEVRRHGSAKVVARELGCSPRTVEGWVQFQPPQIRHLAMAVCVWGRPALERLFAPLLPPADDGDLLARLAQVQADMDFIVAQTEELIAGEPDARPTDAEAMGAAVDRGAGMGACADRPAGGARVGMARPAGAQAVRQAAGRAARTVASTGRNIVAIAVVVSLSWSLAAGDRPDMVRGRVRSRPAAARMVRSAGRGVA